MAWPDLSDLESRVRDLLNEASAGFFTDVQIKRWINDGERDVAIKTLCIEGICSITTVANTRTVATPFNKVLAVEYVPATEDPRGLAKITPLHVGHYCEPGEEPQAWFPWGKTVGIEPIPQSAYPLNVYASILPTCEMSDSTDEPQVPRAFRLPIVHYAFIRGLLKDRKYARAGIEYRSYIADLQVVRDLVLNKYVDRKQLTETPDMVVER